MVIIRFHDAADKSRALGFLAGRFSFTSWATGEMVVPDEALAALNEEAIPFCVEDIPDQAPTWAEAVAAHRRGESLDPVDAFAALARVGRDEWLRRVAERKTNRDAETGA